MSKEIVVARDFSDCPGARYREDGPKSGQEFYEELLKQVFADALSSNAKLRIVLDGTNGYATSFLDQAFGELAKNFGVEKVLGIIDLVSEEEPELIEDIQGYIHDAHKT